MKISVLASLMLLHTSQGFMQSSIIHNNNNARPSLLLSPLSPLSPSLTFTALSMAKKKSKSNKKGFGKSTPKKQTQTESAPESTSTTSSSNNASSSPSSTSSTSSSNDSPLIPSAGKDALARLRRQKAEERNEELRAIRDMKAVDEYVSAEPDAAVIPEKVAQRMGKRMLPFVGIPLFGVMGTFIVFWYLATYKNMEFQPALVAFSTIAVLGLGLLGITYSVMSASWDPEEEGSLLGTEEFSKNLGNISAGLKRSRENAILREKMVGLPDAEINQAINDLEKRETKTSSSKMSLSDKLEKELE